MSRKEDLDAAVKESIQRLSREFADLGKDLPWTLTRSAIHQAIHYAVAARIQYCTLVTYLAEMIGHAHELAHRGDARVHEDRLH